ncbi:hypothetical protein AB2L28_06505 [Kineococcus sp. TBRC 1896]|uniref:GDSL-like lipase/acylhydrolase family protein n=1 Tax=Kineococcus mangrovi TaxID=1660183 RepID=A0ABV4HZN5_9ACTN
MPTAASDLGLTLTTAVRPPVEDPTLGIDVPTPPARPRAHRFAAVGDSLTQGFKHYAVHDRALSWPALVTDLLGVPFARPHDHGPGGYPLNLEFLARRALGRPVLPGLVAGFRYALEVRRAYEHPPGPRGGPRYEDLAVWGWDLRDHLVRTADTERARLRPGPPTRLDPRVRAPNARAAVEVLDGSRTASGEALTSLRAVRDLDGGVETLCVWLGSNNVLRSVVELRVVASGPRFREVGAKDAYTVWTVPDFTAELAEVARAVAAVDADRVLWGTVPHVTIPPIARGLGGPLPECGRYFRFYARPWASEETFDPDRDRHLTGFDAWAVDQAVDGYNRALLDVVGAARDRGRDWRVVDVAAMLDRLAVRRNEELGARPPGFAPYPLPAALEGLDTRFPATDDAGRLRAGGLIGLDGLHPTTCGYGLVAQEFATVLAGAGVEFPGGHRVDFGALRRRDTFVSDPPAGVGTALRRIGRLDRWTRPLR